MVLIKISSVGVYFFLCLRFYFHGLSVLFCFYSFAYCETLALGLEVERSAVGVVSFNLPKFGLASYIALFKVISSESRPWADGYMRPFHVLVLLLIAILMI
ncbi:unnamed protein product [Cuscuta epithymum]|uniref:Uncharacterized protein n=1 Tax=Cuscuta epithymum TaxID=186058 RepID=A0AAV0C685_9ASTE|nr:unnamed protein product [Cuscuta epithymum]